MKVSYIFTPPWATWAPSYAMCLLRASAKKEGHDFIGFDLNIDFYNHVEEDDKNQWHNPDMWRDACQLEVFEKKYTHFIDNYVNEILLTNSSLYAFSINTDSTLFACAIARRIKRIMPDRPVIFGGPNSFRSGMGLELLERPEIDAICTGEADIFWPKYLSSFEANNFKFSEISGICFKNDSGTIIDCGDPEIPKDLNALPFADYEEVDFSKYSSSSHVALAMSRGCINRCAFCSDSPRFRKYRYRSPNNIIDEIRPLVRLFKERYGVTPYINFNDSLINALPLILEELCDVIINEKIHFTWGGMALLREEMTRELFLKMKAAGCVAIMWGLESGCRDVLKLMKKDIFSLDLAEKIFKCAYEIGILQYTNIIVGFPGETEEMFMETANFMARNKDYFHTIGLPTLEIKKGSLIYKKYEEYGIVFPDKPDDWQTIDGSNTRSVRVERQKLLGTIIDDKLLKRIW